MRFKRTKRMLRRLGLRRQRKVYPSLLQKRDGNPTAEDAFHVRRFDAASNNRLNRCRWINAHGNSINSDLADLPTLMARCAHEAANNPIVAGALETLETDIVGRNGPRMQVVSDDERFNEAVEKAWREVWAMPDPTGLLAGPENMRLWIRQLNTAGSFLNVFANVNRQGPVNFGWKTIHPRRLVTPAEKAGDPNTLLGIEFNNSGRPVVYHLSRYSAGGINLGGLVDTQPVRASLVQHRFIADEPEQVTGYPSLTPCLETIADLREYDAHVMDAAKKSAALTPFLEAWSPEAVIDPDPLPAGGLDIEVGKANDAPLGWRWNSLSSTQPTAQYKEFRHERLRELGICLGMPLMMILLSSAESNFSSAHYDGAVYLRRIRSLQSWLERRTLNELLEQVIVELVVASSVTRPESYSFRWTWETPPYVNPEKQRKADRMAVEDGAMPLDEYSSSLGLDWDEVVAARQRIADQLEAAGLPPVPVNSGSGGGASQTLRDVANQMDQTQGNAANATANA